jgi:hypothetical protein
MWSTSASRPARSSGHDQAPGRHHSTRRRRRLQALRDQGLLSQLDVESRRQRILDEI